MHFSEESRNSLLPGQPEKLPMILITAILMKSLLFSCNPFAVGWKGNAKGTHLAVGKIFHEHRNIQQRENRLIETRWSQLKVSASIAELVSPCKTARHSLCHVRNPREDRAFVFFWHIQRWTYYWPTLGPQFTSLPLVWWILVCPAYFSHRQLSGNHYARSPVDWQSTNPSSANGVYILWCSVVSIPHRGSTVKSCSVNQMQFVHMFVSERSDRIEL